MPKSILTNVENPSVSYCSTLRRGIKFADSRCHDVSDGAVDAFDTHSAEGRSLMCMAGEEFEVRDVSKQTIFPMQSRTVARKVMKRYQAAGFTAFITHQDNGTALLHVKPRGEL